jgi:hypothetical protein
MFFLGFDEDSQDLNFSLLDKKKNLCHKKTIHINGSPIDVKKHYIDNLPYNKIFIATGIDSSDIVVKKKPFNITQKGPNRTKAIEFSAKSMCPIDIDKCIFNYEIIDKNIHYSFAEKKTIKSHLLDLKKFKIDIDHVCSKTTALAHFVKFIDKNLKKAIVVHLANNSTICTYYENGFCIKSFTIDTGRNTFKKCLSTSKVIENVDFSKLEKNKKIQNSFDKLKKEIFRTVLSFQLKNESENFIIFSGKAHNLINFCSSTIEYICSKKIKLKKFSNDLLERHRSSAISIGLGIDSINSHENSFIKDDLFPKKHLRYIFKNSSIFFGCVIISCISIILTASLITNRINKKSEKVVSQIVKNEKVKIPQNEENLENKIIFLEEENEKQAKAFPYFNNQIKVIEFIKWINNHLFLKNSKILKISYNYEKKEKAVLATIETNFLNKNDEQKFISNLKKEKNDFVNLNKKITTKEINLKNLKISFYLKPINYKKAYAK